MPDQAQNIQDAIKKARADWLSYTDAQMNYIYDIFDESADRIDDLIRKYAKDNWRKDFLYGIKDSIKKEMAQLRDKVKFQTKKGMKNSIDYGLKQGMRNANAIVQDKRRIKLGSSYISKSGKIMKWDPAKDTVETALWSKINRNALEAVIKFSENVSGLTFSENIWKNLENSQRQIRKTIVRGLIEGRSPAKISQDVRGFLHEPKKLFRRVRDKKTGKLRLSKAAQEYHPGQGVYRSSYMNAMRLARTEYSRAYNEGLQRYAQRKDFIKGYIWRIGSGNPCPDCLVMSGEFFPKEAPPSIPAHPQCMCWLELAKKAPEEYHYNTTGIEGQWRGEELGKVFSTKVKYLNAQQRKAYRLFIKDGKLYDAKGNLFDTSLAKNYMGNKRAIGVLSPDGKIYASLYQKRGKFHHSSFLSGGQAAWAGELQVKKGKLLMINIRSGHYKPKLDKLNQVAKHLKSKGVNLKDIDIRQW